MAVTLAPVEAERVAAGVQLYVVPPVAERLVEEPLHMATFEPPLMVGIGLTVAVTAVLEAVTLDPLVALI